MSHHIQPNQLHLASSVGKSPNVLKELIAAFGVDKRDGKNRTPLMFSALNKYRTNCCMSLLKANAKAQLQDDNGFTALHIACYNGNRTALNALLSYKASLFKPDNLVCSLLIVKRVLNYIIYISISTLV